MLALELIRSDTAQESSVYLKFWENTRVKLDGELLGRTQNDY